MIAVAVNVAGRLRLLPDTFDTNGIGIGFALDSESYRAEIVTLVETLFQRGPTGDGSEFADLCRDYSFHLGADRVNEKSPPHLLAGVDVLTAYSPAFILHMALEFSRNGFGQGIG